MRFFVGLHQPSDAKHFERSFISINRIRERKSVFQVQDWIMDSGAFSELFRHGHYRHSVKDYARSAARWIGVGRLRAIVAQDYMCEPFIVAKTGLSIREHQRLTVERYDRLMDCALPMYVLPVLQGYDPDDYVRHLDMYGDRFAPFAHVGVGSVCKRNARPSEVETVLQRIKAHGPDLRLHGFGLKKTALVQPIVRRLLESADSMAWSFHARKNGRNANDWREAKRFEEEIAMMLN